GHRYENHAEEEHLGPEPRPASSRRERLAHDRRDPAGRDELLDALELEAATGTEPDVERELVLATSRAVDRHLESSPLGYQEVCCGPRNRRKLWEVFFCVNPAGGRGRPDAERIARRISKCIHCPSSPSQPSPSAPPPRAPRCRRPRPSPSTRSCRARPCRSR